MKVEDILDYFKKVADNCPLREMDIKIKLDEESCEFYVDNTKEKYVYDDEGAADEKIDELQSTVGFNGVDRKYKEAKFNKKGECTRDATWTVTAKLGHN